MPQEKTFTDEEYKDMAALTSDLVHAAIDAGDRAKAHELLDRLVAETRGIHDAYLLWLTATQSFIYREMGIDAFERSQIEAFPKTALAWTKHGLPPDPSFKERVAARAFGIRSHAVELMIEEDDEKVSFRMKGCASGARLLEMGFFEEGQGGALIKEERPLTFNRKDFPVYCTHCALQQMPTVAAGNPLTIATIPEKDLRAGLCQFNLYKSGHSAPESHVETLRDKQHKAGV